MVITFLVGNGFDIRMGLQSSYKSLEKYYVGIKKEDPVLQQFQQAIESSGELWADFETALGGYTAAFSADEQWLFQKCMDDFSTELTFFLQEEEKGIDYDLCSEEIKAEFLRSFSKFDDGIPNRQLIILNTLFTESTGITFKFISFNYTHVFDKCLKTAFPNEHVEKKQKKTAPITPNVSKEVIHIHGELPGPVIMGVDNETQIANINWAKQRKFQRKLMKPSINQRSGSLADEAANKLLHESNIICIYGMSLGETDKSWWRAIGSWLMESDHMLIIYGYTGTPSFELTLQKKFDIEDAILDKFFTLADIDELKRPGLENKIAVVVNPDLFNINLSSLTLQKKHWRTEWKSIL